MTFIFLFFCLPPGSQYKFHLFEKHSIKLEWPYQKINQDCGLWTGRPFWKAVHIL